MMRPTLTVLTTPVLPAPRRVYRRARRMARLLLKPGVPIPSGSAYPGHYAVTRSVVEGLRAIGADFNFNPTTFRELGSIVYAPANEALRQAIELKRAGKIAYVAAGPVNALLPDEAGGTLLRQEIDLVIVASAWVLDLFDTEPHLRAKARVCPCGVDPEFWRPQNLTRDRVLVYSKGVDDELCSRVEAVVRGHALNPIRISAVLGDHSRFTQAQYRDALARSTLAVFLSAFETQGIALAEAWSMNVPTLAWNPRGDATWRGRSFRAGSSCPYLTRDTGREWRTLDELDIVVRDAITARGSFHPRRWVLEHMTDAICARVLHAVIMDGAHALATVR